jgi:radical SAM superfamily enzyme YgiQ (UPF0313 family)
MYNYFYLVVLCVLMFNIYSPFPILKIYKRPQVHEYIYTHGYGLCMFYHINTHTHMWTCDFKYIF